MWLLVSTIPYSFSDLLFPHLKMRRFIYSTKIYYDRLYIKLLSNSEIYDPVLIIYTHIFLIFHLSSIKTSYNIHYPTQEYIYHFLFIFLVHFLFRFRSFSSKFELKWRNTFLEFQRKFIKLQCKVLKVVNSII